MRPGPKHRYHPLVEEDCAMCQHRAKVIHYPKPETRDLKPETRNPKPGTRNMKLETRNPKLEARDPKSETEP
jgi:hypothetical protein